MGLNVASGGSPSLMDLPVKKVIMKRLYVTASHPNDFDNAISLKLDLPSGKYLITLLHHTGGTTPEASLNVRLLLDDSVSVLDTTSEAYLGILGYVSPASASNFYFGVHENEEGYQRPIYVEGALKIQAYGASNREIKVEIRELY